MTDYTNNEYINDTCCFCDKSVKYVRHTQFAGSHPFCEECGPKQKGFMSESSYEFWEEIFEKTLTIQHMIGHADHYEMLETTIGVKNDSA